MMEGSRWTTAQNRWTERLEALGSKITGNSITLTSVIHHFYAAVSTQNQSSYLFQNKEQETTLPWLLSFQKPSLLADLTFFLVTSAANVCVCLYALPFSNLSTHTYRLTFCFRFSAALGRGGTAQAHMSSTTMSEVGFKTRQPCARSVFQGA